MTKLNQTSQTCPHCSESLISQEIPKEARHFYLPMVKNPETDRYEEGPDDGRFLFYSRVIGIYCMDTDRAVAYKCPFCGVVDKLF
jgi:predicted RNA-binding Zn-ribbon protein involved in translation (DUF1610 family)